MDIPGDSQRKFVVLCGAAALGSLMEQGYIEGNFTVNMDRCYAAMKILDATEDITPPTRAQVIEMALDLMKQAGGFREDDEEMFKLLLENDAVIEWELSE